MNAMKKCIAVLEKNDSSLAHSCTPEELRTAVASGIASGQGIPSDEFFGRLESKYRNLAKE